MLEAGFVPTYGMAGLQGASFADVEAVVQTLLEPIAKEILKADHDRVAEKEAIVAAAEAVLAPTTSP